MKKFSFSLQTILNLAISEEKKLMFDIGQLNFQKNKMIEKINQYNRELSSAFEMPFEDNKLTEGKFLSLMPPVFKGIRIKIENVKNEINKLDNEINNKKNILFKKKSEIKTFQKLRENELIKFKTKYQKYIQSEAEEGFIMNKTRKKDGIF